MRGSSERGGGTWQIAGGEGGAPSADPREKILEETVGILYREGPQHVTMRSLAEKLGVAPSTIYLYFESKEALLKEIALRGFDALAEAMEPAESIADPLEAVADAARRYAEFGLAHPELYRLMFQDISLSGRLDPAERERVLRAWRLSQRLYRRGIESGAFRPTDPDLEASLGWAWVHGFVLLASAGRLPVGDGGAPSLRCIREAMIEGRLRALRRGEASEQDT